MKLQERQGLIGRLGAAALIAFAGSQALAVPRLGTAVVVKLRGNVEYESPAGRGALEEGMALGQGHSMMTKDDGRLVAILTPGCILCVAPESRVDLKQIEMTTEGLPDQSKRIDKNVTLNMANGAMRFDGGRINPNLHLRVTTPVGDVTASGGRAIVAQDGALWRVLCEESYVTFESGGEKQTIKKGEAATITRATPDAKINVAVQPIQASGYKDDFAMCRRAADRLAPIALNVDYVNVEDLRDYIGTRDSLSTINSQSYWYDVSPSHRKPVEETTRRNLPPSGVQERARLGREPVWDWFDDVGVIRGVNFVPSTAVNSTEMWQKDSFDLDTIDKELKLAAQTGYTAVRVFMPYMVWESDPDGLKERMKDFLGKARKYELKTAVVLFDDNKQSGKEPYLGKQADPVPGVHNSGWTPSPGSERVANKESWGKLEQYVKDVVGSFRRDRRILFWDLYNEPGSYGMGDKSLPLAEAAFEWARSADPVQPLTAGIWSDMSSRMSKTLMELSDVITFRGYENEEDLRGKMLLCQTDGRPVLCTEWLRRDKGNTFEKILPVFAQNRVGWFNWGLVAGKTQTYIPVESKPGPGEPPVWQVDVLRQNGEPYDKKEVELIRNFLYEK